jgi:hypothetical protein
MRLPEELTEVKALIFKGEIQKGIARAGATYGVNG